MCYLCGSQEHVLFNIHLIWDITVNLVLLNQNMHKSLMISVDYFSIYEFHSF